MRWKVVKDSKTVYELDQTKRYLRYILQNLLFDLNMFYVHQRFTIVSMRQIG